MFFYLKIHKSDSKKQSVKSVAKTISEANAIAVRVGLADKADFSDLSLESANMIIQTMIETKKNFSFIPKLEFIGNPNYSPINEDKVTALGNGIAWIRKKDANGGVRSLCLKEEYFRSNNDEQKEHLKYLVESKYHPEGCSTLKSQVDHEIGHMIDASLNLAISNNAQIKSLYQKHMNIHSKSEKHLKMGNILSHYARTDREEFVAEAWAEYRNNPTPRLLATEVGKIIESYMKKS